MKKSPKAQNKAAPEKSAMMDGEEFARLKIEYNERKAAAQARYYKLLNDVECRHLLRKDFISYHLGKVRGVYTSMFLQLPVTTGTTHGGKIAIAAEGKRKDANGIPYSRPAALLKIEEIMTNLGYETIGKMKQDMEAWIETLPRESIE
ncbi:hypothetical protein FACS189479_04950 [Spirochaetia bacterium]|nr:hypothetical protein FACS189479_04950 [Spirochaetia bacterium]